MLSITGAIRWSWVLGIALFLPVALPAGGSDTFPSDHLCTARPNPLLLVDNSCLQASPYSSSPILRTLEIGTPLNILRTWQASDGKKWLQVRIASNEIIELSSSARRGWINV